MSYPSVVQSDGAVLETLLELTPDPVWLVDDRGTVTRSNAAFARWRGFADAAAVTLETIRKRANEGRNVMANVDVLTGGIERTFAVHAQRVYNHTVLFVAHDLGESSTTEGGTERGLLNLFTTDESLLNILPEALHFLGAAEGWDAAIVWLREGDDELRAAAWWFGFEAAELEERLPSLRVTRGHGAPGRAFASRELVWIPDILDETVKDRSDLFAAAGLRAMAAIPLLDSDHAIGVLEFMTRAVKPIDGKRKVHLSRTAAALGRLIVRHRTDEERRRLLLLVERKGAEWMSTFDSIHLPILIATCDGRIARLNLAARDLTGAGFDDVLGRELRSIGEGEPWPTLQDITAAVRDSRMAGTAQIARGEHPWDVSASLLEAPSPYDERVIIVLHETTQLKHLQDAVRRGEQLAALGELVAGVAHAVKNPIFGMDLTLDLLAQQPGTAETAELLAALRKWITRLSAITENLFEYGRTWTIDLKPGSIDRVLEQAIEMCRPRADSKNVTIEVEGRSGRAAVLMDATRLAHVFENLLTNAIQFSPTGHPVEVSITVDANSVSVVLHDRGRGFNAEDLPRLGQPFFTTRSGGTGLGMAIVQRIVDEHGGTLTATNHAEGGAVVRVRFPRYKL